MVRQVRKMSLRGPMRSGASRRGRQSNLNPTNGRFLRSARNDIPVEETEFWKQMEKNRIGNLLAGARLKAGLTQGQLTKKLGIRQNMVSDYERGRRSLSPTMMAWFSAVLHVKGSYLKRGNGQSAGH